MLSSNEMENTASHSDLSLQFLWGILLGEHLTKMLWRFFFSFYLSLVKEQKIILLPVVIQCHINYYCSLSLSAGMLLTAIEC